MAHAASATRDTRWVMPIMYVASNRDTIPVYSAVMVCTTARVAIAARVRVPLRSNAESRVAVMDAVFATMEAVSCIMSEGSAQCVCVKLDEHVMGNAASTNVANAKTRMRPQTRRHQRRLPHCLNKRSSWPNRGRPMRWVVRVNRGPANQRNPTVAPTTMKPADTASLTRNSREVGWSNAAYSEVNA